MAQLTPFDTYWRNKFLEVVKKYTDIPAEKLRVLHDNSESSTNSEIGPLEWTAKAMRVVEENSDITSLKDVMTRCACTYPEKTITHLRDSYRETGDLAYVHSELQKQFLTDIRPYKQLKERHMDFIIQEGMGMAGKLEGSLITAVKIPKDFKVWFESGNEQERRKLYCHCPRIREYIGTEKDTAEKITAGQDAAVSGNTIVPEDYCLCGAGFYRHLWEFILEREVRVRVTDSIISGGNRCVIEIDVG